MMDLTKEVNNNPTYFATWMFHGLLLQTAVNNCIEQLLKDAICGIFGVYNRSDSFHISCRRSLGLAQWKAGFLHGSTKKNNPS